jgi:replicative DNA helicase
MAKLSEKQQATISLEQSVLGGIILRPPLLSTLQSLEVDDFFDMRSRIVFQAMRNLETASRPIDVVTLEGEIERSGKLEAIGGVAFLGELALRVPTADHVHDYVREIRGESMLRRLALATADIVERARTWEYEPDELLVEAMGRLAGIRERYERDRKPVRLISVGQALEELDRLAKAPVYPTPFPTLNDAIGFGGLLGTQVYTLSAGTGRGKTSWVAELAGFAAQSVPVLVASYEMKPGYFVARKAAGVLGVHSNEILRGRVSMRSVLATIPYGRFFLMHKPPLDELRAAIQLLTTRFGTPPLVVVDYLQKLADQIARNMQRPDPRIATTEASDTLIDIADKSGCAIVSVSAIGRTNNKRTANPRQLEPYDLVDVSKESGSVEYDGAGMIVLSLSKEHDDHGRIATMTLAKARFGEECHIDARYDGRRGTWLDRGRVEAVDEMVANVELQKKILRALDERPAASKEALWKRVKGNKKAFGLEFDALEKLEMISKNPSLPGDGITLSDLGRNHIRVGS